MLENALTISDLKRMARRRVPKMFFDYADSGAWTEQTYRAKLLYVQRGASPWPACGKYLYS